MKRVLLTGASGTVGKEVLLQLCELPDEYEVTVFDKESKASKSFYRKLPEKFNLIYGDISSENDIARVCSDKDIIIHLAAIIPPLADKFPKLAEAVNIKGTKNLISSAEQLSPDAFFIYSSSISVYGDRKSNQLIKTNDKLIASARDEYAKTKIAAEKLIKGSRLKWTIFRLTAIMGINNHKPSSIMFHMPLETGLEIATPRDTGRAFVNATRHPEVLNKNIYNLGGGEKCRISYEEFLSRSFEIFGLGNPDFPKGSFANKNFHCGYYADGDILNDILDFRRDTIEDYFLALRKSVSPSKRLATRIFRKIILRRLRKQSEPLSAIITENQTDILHYF